MSEYQDAATYDGVKKRIKTPEIKDGTYLIDWITETNCTYSGMSYEQIAAKWDARPYTQEDIGDMRTTILQRMKEGLENAVRIIAENLGDTPA